MDTQHIFQEERPWGNFRQFTKNIPSTVKIITIKPNEILSLQSHQNRSEFWRIIGGNGTVEINGESHETKMGDEWFVGVEVKHRMSAGDEGMMVLEIASGNFDENDIIRFEDKYDRA